MPYISLIVATHTWDAEHSELFVRAWIEQAKRYGLDSELIVAVGEPLSSALRSPTDTEPCDVRFIELPMVSPMVAKNAGIRRARGEFLLSTSIDTLFSDELVRFLASRELARGRLYRIDRGDFILMAREHWLDVRGYAELDRSPRHLDTLLCLAACQGGVQEEILPETMQIHRQEHGPDTENGDSIPDEEAAWLVSQMRSLQAPLIFNTDDWGLGELALTEAGRAIAASSSGIESPFSVSGPCS